MDVTVEGLVQVVFFASLPLVVPAAMYLSEAQRARLAWPAVVTLEPLDVEPAGPYRGPALPILVPRAVSGAGGPPLVVRAAAFASYFLGQMFFPGLLYGLIGLYYFGIGLISIPGLWLAWQALKLGTALLRRDPGAAAWADRAAFVAYVLNAVVFVVGVVVAFMSEFGFFLVGYALVSIGHGVLLQKAASALRAVTAIDP